MELNPYRSPCTRVNLRWIKDLEIRPDTLKLLEDGIDPTLQHIGTSRNFLNETPKAQEIKTRINKLDGIKLKSFCSSKETIKSLKRKPTEWEKIFANYPSDRGLISRIYKELKRLYTKKTNNPIKKWGIELNRHITKEEIQMANN